MNIKNGERVTGKIKILLNTPTHEMGKTLKQYWKQTNNRFILGAKS